jgi:regulator of protease activity HflC (stomatin/prohibitin superfamily)
MEYLLVALAVLIAVYLRLTIRGITVFEFEQGLKYRNGRFRGVLGPGRHWIYRPQTMIRKVDTRPRFVSLAGQEVLSADGVTLKVSLAAEYQLADPERAINKVENYEQALYLTLQFAIREMIGQANIEDVLARREEFGSAILEKTASTVDQLGLKLLSVNVKDVMFPGDLKKIFTQVVQAQKEGQAALEKARGETAALRNLANAAKMVEGNPTLLQLPAPTARRLRREHGRAWVPARQHALSAAGAGAGAS